MAQFCPLIHIPQQLIPFAFPILFVYTLLTEDLQQAQNTATFYCAVRFSNVCANKYAIISQLLTLNLSKMLLLVFAHVRDSLLRRFWILRRDRFIVSGKRICKL